MKPLSAAGFLFILQAAAPAQAPAPAAPPADAVRNGGFERVVQTPNLWSGVDKDGFLSGFRGFLPVLNESGNITDTPMPVSVAAGDMNGDGLTDLASSDPLGYIRIYFNTGSKEQPKFSSGELSLPYLALAEGVPPWMPPDLNPQEKTEWMQHWVKRRQGVRISMAPSSSTDKLDLIAGNYFGEVFLVPNRGTAQSPQFAQPPSLVAASLLSGKDPRQTRWGNVFAPLLHDWNGDGKPDLLLGEGSYSANNIHLLPNAGSGAAPSFDSDKKQVLALGDGREQLTPALADVDGQGGVDLLVADRGGRITVYLRPENWKAGDAIKPSGFIGKGGGITPADDPTQALVLGSGIHTISTGDLNSDGLFDLVIGKSNGRIAWAPNKGSKGQPKFDAPADIKGEKPSPLAWSLPSQWDLDVGTSRGNYGAYATCVSVQEDAGADAKEGTKVLKFGYAASANKLLPRPALPNRAETFFERKGDEGRHDNLFRASAEARGNGGPANFFVLRQPVQLQIGKTYTLSFQAKGDKVSNAEVVLGWRGSKQLGEDRLIRGERGAVKREYNSISDSEDQAFDLRPGANWAAVTKQFKIEFKKERDLNKEKTTSEGILEIRFDLEGPDGFLCLDDIKLVPSAP